MLAFTTRIPLAVMIVKGIKQWENRSAMPIPMCGMCGITCSKSSDNKEYDNFLTWAKETFSSEIYDTLPVWEQIKDWRGNLIATCQYNATRSPGPEIWNEGYAVWWHLTNVQLLNEPIPCRGNVGMWQLPKKIAITLINAAKC